MYIYNIEIYRRYMIPHPVRALVFCVVCNNAELKPISAHTQTPGSGDKSLSV